MEDPADETQNPTDVPPHRFWFDLTFPFEYGLSTCSFILLIHAKTFDLNVERRKSEVPFHLDLFYISLWR